MTAVEDLMDQLEHALAKAAQAIEGEIPPPVPSIDAMNAAEGPARAARIHCRFEEMFDESLRLTDHKEVYDFLERESMARFTVEEIATHIRYLKKLQTGIPFYLKTLTNMLIQRASQRPPQPAEPAGAGG